MSDRKPTDSRPAWTRLHLWQIQPIRDVLLIAGVLAILLLGYKLSLVTVPLLLALLLAYLFEPVVIWMTRRLQMSRPAAAIGLIAIVALTVAIPVTVGVAFAAVQAVEGAQEVGGNVRALSNSVKNPENQALREILPSKGWRWLRDRIVEFEHDEPALPPVESETASTPAPSPERMSLFAWASERLQEIAAGIAASAQQGAFGREAIATGRDAVAAVWRALLGFGAFVFGVCLTTFFFFFFSTGYERARSIRDNFIPERKRARALELLGKMDRVVSGFVRGRLTIAAVQIVYFTVAYALIGAPAPLLLGPLVGVLSAAPYLGAISVPITIGAMFLDPPSALAFQSSWWWIVFAPTFVFWLGQAMDDYLLSPLIQSKATDMDTPTILFASITGGLLAGVYGLLIAIPVAACAKILVVETIAPRLRAWTRGEVSDPLPFEDGSERRGG